MKCKPRYLIFGMLFMLSTMVCIAQSVLKISSEERTRYQEEVSHFVQETYYGSLQEYIVDDAYRDYIIEKLMLDSEVRYKPEFCVDKTSDMYMSPARYLQELSRSFSCYEEEEISISVDGIDVSDCFFSHGLTGCYAEATYRTRIQCSGKELYGGRCRMYCLFPNKAVRKDIRVLQVEPIRDERAYVDVQTSDYSVANIPDGIFSLEGGGSIISRYLFNWTLLYALTLLIVVGSVLCWLYKKGGIESLKKAFSGQNVHSKSTEKAPDKDVYHPYEESESEPKNNLADYEDINESMDIAIVFWDSWEFDEAVKYLKD